MMLRVGIAGPMSGPRRAYGDRIRASVELYSWPFEVMFADDRAETKTALSVAQGFVKAGVDVVIGHFNSECARVAGHVYRDYDIPLLLPASTAPELTHDVGAFRLCASELSQIDAMSAWVNLSRIKFGYIWYDDTAYGRRLALAARQKLKIKLLTRPMDNAAAFLFGTHLNTATRINDVFCGQMPGPIIVGDDCSIDEFAGLVDTVRQTRIYVATPKPDFFAALQDGLTLIKRLDQRMPLLSQLMNCDHFSDGERLGASFDLVQLRNRSDTSKNHTACN